MYAVIMAGGGGTRLWPLSRDRRPKPFLPLLDDGRSLLEGTVSRLAPLIGPDDVYVVTDVRYAGAVREVAPLLPASNIIGEPMGRNTAAAVALMAHLIDRPADEVMVVLPADQSIRDEAGFRMALAVAAERAASGDLVTMGIEPTEPSTGYGYVVATGEPTVHAALESFRVERFEEKPELERARALVASRSAWWNAGIFVWRRDAILGALAAHAPDISRPIRDWARTAAASGEAGWPGEALAGTYEDLRATSIDYALMEPASVEGRVAVVPASIGWSDLGTWSAIRDQRAGAAGGTTDEGGKDDVGGKADEGGRAVITAEPPARVIDVGSEGVLVHATGGRLVAIVGLDDIIVVDTPDALLVTSARGAQDVKQVVDRLRSDGRDDLL